MPIVVDDNIPDFLRKFLISQGVISVKDTETGETAVVPLQPRRRPRLNIEGGMEGDFEEGSPITTAASGDFLDTLRGLFSSDTPMSAEDIATNQALAEAAEKNATDKLTYNLERGQPITYGMVSTSLGENPYDNPTIITDPLSLEILTEDVISDKVLLDRAAEKDYEDPTRSLTTSPQDLAFLSSGNSILDGAVNLFSGFGNFVDNSLSKIGGLFSGGISNPFDFDYTPSISDRYGPMGPLSAAATALSDPYLSTSQKVGQTLGGVLGAGASAVIPGASLLGLLGVGLGRMGAHHDFDPSTDYNLNFDTRSGRTDWGSLSPGAGGVQYGSLSNENMIEDIAKDNPDYEISLNDGKDGYITAGEFVDINDAYKDIDSSVAFLGPQNFSEALVAAADSPGDMFRSFGGGTLGEALTEYGQTGTGAFMNEAGAMLGPNAGYNETKSLADQLAAQADLVTSGLFDTDTDIGGAAASDIASGVSSYTGADIGTDTSGPDMSTDDDFGNWDFDF